MDGKQEIDFIDEDAKQLGFAFIFAKYIFPTLAALGGILLILFIGFFLLNDFGIETLETVGTGAFIIIVLALLLALNKR